MSELERLATTIEQWIDQFWMDACSNKIRSYDEIPDELWQFIWICISRLKYESAVLRSLEKLPCEKSFTWSGEINVLWEGVYLNWIKTEIVKIINTFETPFTISLDDKLWFDRYTMGYSSQELTLEQKSTFDHRLEVKTVCPGKAQEYVFLLQCLLGSEFTHTMFFTAGNNREMTSLRYTKKRKPIQAYTTWFMPTKTYQRCLKLFPRWPLIMSSEWHQKTRKLCEIYLIPDLVSICIGFL